ncbi:MAG: hypothetical protein KBA06_05540, partial [Saprospiraceae bacterium]|nr:hypothetical protein [Saprospiraceae bacterium]
MDKNFFKPYRIGLIAIIFISCSITFYKFHKIILHPTEYYLSGGGDAYKTYFCGMYHIKYDSTYHHSQQMNHPYGDHINFIDIQPVVVNFMKFLSNIFDYDLSDYYIPAIDYFILISLTIAAILLYFLLVNLRLPVWYSVILSIAITYLSPQIARFNGHFGLSYIFVIPTILYLLHKFEINRSFK